MKTTLRPLTGPEQEAVLMLQDGKPMDVIERETGLRRAEIVAADDLSKQWGTIAQSANGSRPASAFTPAKLDKALLSAPPKPVAPTFRAAPAPPISDAAPAASAPEPGPDVEAAAALDEPPVAVEIDVPVCTRGDANDTLARAEKSTDPGILDAAHEIRALLDGLDKRMDVSESTSAARARVESLQKQLAEALAELTALGAGPGLIGTVATPPAASTVKSAPDAEDQPAWTTAEVRGWCRQKGIVIADRGRIPSPLLAEFLADRAKATA